MMATFSRARSARPNGLVPGFASRADMLAALRSLHLKRSQILPLFGCSRAIGDKLMARPDFPAPVDLTEDGHNPRYVTDEIMAWRDTHRREISAMTAKPAPRPPIAPPPTAEAAVRQGLAALRGEKKSDRTDFR